MDVFYVGGIRLNDTIDDGCDNASVVSLNSFVNFVLRVKISTS